MRLVISVLLALLMMPAFRLESAAQTPSSQDVDVIRTETDLTNLLFIATDKNNRYITTLQQGDVRVLEDGVPQTLFTFQRETDRPLAIAFLIDVSGSEERTLPEEKAAARTFVENVMRSGKDQAAIVPFEGYAHLEQPLTRDVIGIYRALERVEVAFHHTWVLRHPSGVSHQVRAQSLLLVKARLRFGIPSPCLARRCWREIPASGGARSFS